MEKLLVLSKRLEVSETDRVEIDLLIDNTIALHKDNASMINKLTFDSVTALAASEGRAKELAKQGFIKRHWNNFTGKNQKLRAQIDADIAKTQYASQQTIQKLAEQNLLTFDLVTAVNNKLNTIVLEMDEEFNQIYKMLGAFFKQTRSDIVMLEARLDKVERNLELLHWNATIEYQVYDGREYAMLSDEEKIVCIANDFLRRTKGSWSTADLMLLKSALGEIGLPIKQVISAHQFYGYLIDHPKLMDRLFEEVSLDGLQRIEPYEASIIKGVEKVSKLNADEKYIIETVMAQFESAQVPYNERDIQLSMVHHYLKNMAYINTDIEVNLFDFVVELLVNLKMVNESVFYDLEVPEEVETEQGNVEEYDVVLFTYGNDKYQLIKELKNVLSIPLAEARELVTSLPATIMSQGTMEEADEVLASVQSLGALARVKTVIDTYHAVRAPGEGKLYLDNGNPHQMISFGDNKKFVAIGDHVKADATVAVIHKMGSSFIYEKTHVLGGISGKVVEIIAEHKQEVQKGDLIMVLRIE